MIKHKQPIENTPSKFVTVYGEEIARQAKGIILDVACGYGRNAAYLASFGASVVCLDQDPIALKFIESTKPSGAEDHKICQLQTRHFDVITNPWDYSPNSIGAIICVHFVLSRGLVLSFANSLKVGGLLLIETFGGNGENYLELPPAGLIKQLLSPTFDIRYYEERKVGPEKKNVSLKLFAVRLH